MSQKDYNVVVAEKAATDMIKGLSLSSFREGSNTIVIVLRHFGEEIDRTEVDIENHTCV